MDFKTAGTAKGLTACQMDIKIKGLHFEILHQALLQAKKGREHILSQMLLCLPEPRKDLSPLAPRIEKLTIPVNTIGAVIGQGGKTIQEIQRVTGTTIHIEEINNTGVVTISSPDLNALNNALKWVKGLTTVPEVGDVYDGKVKGFGKDGAFIELFPGKEAWLHISEVSHHRINSVEDEIQIGETFPVKVIQVDLKTNKFRVSRKALIKNQNSDTQSHQKKIFENKNKK
jgi:polyribonucleotide nucleotidyltransferase